MRYAAFTLALFFALAPMEAAKRRSTAVHPVNAHMAKAKRAKKAPKVRKAKRPAKQTRQVN